MLRKSLSKLLFSITTVIAFVSGSVVVGQNPGGDPAHFSPEEHLVVDVRPLVQDKQLKNGLNLIFTTPKGQSISAKVRHGKIVDWVVTNKDGRTIPTAQYSLVAIQPDARAKVVRCWRCHRNPDGSFDCFAIPCPFSIPSFSLGARSRRE